MKNNIKYIISLIVLTAAFICLGNMVMAENHKVVANETVEEKEVIKAENIGVKTIEKEIVEEPVVAEAIAEDKTVDENPVNEDPVYKEETEPVKEEDLVDDEPVYESPEVPEGKVEGYIEGEYFDPNTTECEISEECYKCEECDFREELFIDEDMNPEGEHWVLGKTCVVCGHGTNEPVTEEFACEYGDE